MAPEHIVDRWGLGCNIVVSRRHISVPGTASERLSFFGWHGSLSEKSEAIFRISNYYGLTGLWIYCPYLASQMNPFAGKWPSHPCQNRLSNSCLNDLKDTLTKVVISQTYMDGLGHVGCCEPV